VDDFIRAEMREQHIPGLSLAVVRDGRVVRSGGYGAASLELNAPATPDTVYPLASLTKPLTATAVLLLAEDGKLGLDDKIGRFLQKTPAAWREVTVGQLLAQTSGIKDYLNELHGKTCNGTSPEEITAAVGELPLSFPPGSRWEYSNTNYVVLQRILQAVSGKSYDELLAERVFRPLGMAATRRNRPDDVVPNRAAGYAWDGERMRNSPYLEPTLYGNADAGLLSSVLDLARWDIALSGGRLLTAAGRERMERPARLAGGAAAPYGLGWHLDTVNGRRLVYHDGNLAGSASWLGRYPDDRLTVIVLTNRGDARAGRIGRHVAGLLAPVLSDAPVADREPAVTALLKTVLAKLRDGTLGPEPFTPEMWKNLYPEGARAFQQILRASGTFRSLALLERKAGGETRTYRYRVEFDDGKDEGREKKRLILDLSLTAGNKISDLSGSQE
jgi:CubicO group peptidase (beta-lactamase class C family)